MKRSSIPRTPMKRRRARVNPVSAGQAEENESRTAVRAEYLLRHALCEARIDIDCGRVSTQVHEPWTRARGGPIDDPFNMLAVCLWCHAWIHANPIEAGLRGWLVKARHGPGWLRARKAET